MDERVISRNSNSDALRQGKGQAMPSAMTSHHKDASLNEHLSFERLISDLSARFVNIAPDQVDAEIEAALKQILDFFQVDRCGLLGLSPDRKRLHVTHAAYGEDIERIPVEVDLSRLFPWSHKRVVIQKKYVSVSELSELPPEAEKDRRSWAAMGVQSSLVIPLLFEGSVSSLIVIASLCRQRLWPDEYIPRLRLLGEIFINALERRNADRALRESEARLSLATEAVGAGLWIMDVGSNRVWVSPKSRELFHFAPDEEIHYESYFRVIHPEDRDRVHQEVQQALRSGENFNCDFRIALPDGSIRWIVARGQRFLKSTGEPDRVMGLSLDITERKRAEEALEESRTQIAAIVNSTKDFIWSVDPERFGLLMWNKAFSDYFLEGRGIRLEVGMTPVELVPPDYVPLWHDLFSRALREGSVVAEYVVVAQTNTLMLSLHAMRRDHGVFGISVFGRDITEFKRKEQELRRSEERFRQVAESVGDFIWEVDANGLYTYTSPAVDKILGYTSDELIRKLHFYDLFAPEVREESKAAAFRVFAAKQSFRAFPNANMNKNGKIVDLETSAVPVLDEAGNLVGYRGSDTDVTERKRAEEALKENEQALRNSQKDLQRLAGRLISAQEEELRRLSRELHDDLTQRLAVLAIEAGKLELDLSKKPESCQETRQTISEMKDQLIKVSEDVHDISRQIHPTILDDLGLVRAIESKCAMLMKQEDIEITIQSVDVPTAVAKDVALCLYRVVQEGLRNVIRHSHARDAEIFLKGTNSSICLTIRDSGSGFDPAKVRQEPGLGLASMRERVQLVKGDFSITSQPGKGTVINACVPLTVDDVL